jgi:tellurite resistance protein TerC
VHSFWLWAVFNIFVLAMLAVDLGVFHRRAHVVSMREATIWTCVWIGLSLLFNAGIYHFLGSRPALEFLTGYLIEKALSVDNIFVFVIIFSYFRVPPQYQHRVLFWGILGALAMRGTLIGAGAFLVQRFDWIMYVFGAFLLLTAVRMATSDPESIEPEHNPALRLLRRIVPVTKHYHGQAFFAREEHPRTGRLRFMATPLLVVLVTVETTDLVFAVDSIPAIFAVTREPFLVYTSNVFAILGLRALYFLLASVIERFEYLKYGLSLVLGFVGVKMLIEDLVHIPIGLSLLIVGSILVSSALLSVWVVKRREARGEGEPARDPTRPRAADATDSPLEPDLDGSQVARASSERDAGRDHDPVPPERETSGDRAS